MRRADGKVWTPGGGGSGRYNNGRNGVGDGDSVMMMVRGTVTRSSRVPEIRRLILNNFYRFK